MSDKSFGDHINRNIVKNSLLSSAVTGLSLEELTHKAVLLPATTQGQVTRLDQQHGSQARTLAYADHDKPSFPSGDAFTKTSLSNTPTNILPNLDRQTNEKNRVTAIGTQSKASVKSEDDFDVNEYIARLQGTRYVSAPLHSHLKEDPNANLDAEESLEEINLNESGTEPEVQQSLTADIAQNFSQLPTVLPHVASAVFNSFSNMLSMKSREQTPDDAKPTYQELQFERPDIGVPLMGVDESAPKDFGLPPKEPPISGISSYRITSKKKYAQIPGLSYGDATQNLYNNPNIPPVPPGYQYEPPLMTPEEALARSKEVAYLHGGVVHDNASNNQNMSTYFTPADSKHDASKNIETNRAHIINTQYGTDTITSDTAAVSDNMSSETSAGYNTKSDGRNTASVHNIKENTSATVQVIEHTTNVLASKESQPNFFTPIDHKDIPAPRLPIIPPPPMFSNPRKVNQTSVGKSVLPPSVARRISANQPLIKPQMIPTQSYSDNIFVPSPIPEACDPVGLPSLPPSITPNQMVRTPSTQPPPFNEPSNLPAQSNPIQYFSPPEQTTSLSIGAPFFVTPSENTPSMGAPILTSPNREGFQALRIDDPNIPIASFEAVPSAHNVGVNMYPTNLVTVSNIPPLVPASSNTAPPSFVPSSQMPPNFFTHQAPQDVPHPKFQMNPVAPEPGKLLVEPPKATGTVNFRMTKKRPQYYSGPIEGVGDISNSVKPIIEPVIPSAPSDDANTYQGSLFTPEQKPQIIEHNTVPNVDLTSVPFDISRPVEPVATYAPFEVKQQQSFTPFDLSQPQQSYGHEYNATFDLSRPTTEAFDPPKQETKSFGIIGSLKSKLSSIDINKIQSTVTTFFDPAYNEAKNEPVYAQQYGQNPQEQSNFEIMVPSVEQNQYIQYGYQHGYKYDQNNQNYQAQNAYNYAQSERESASTYFTPNLTAQQVNTGKSLNIDTQECSSAPTNYTQENIPQNVENLSIHKVDQEKKHEPDKVTFFDPAMVQRHTQAQAKTVASYYKSSISPHVGLHGAIGDIAKASNHPPIGIEQSYKHIGNPVTKAPTFFDSPLVGPSEFESKIHDTYYHATKDSQTDMAQSKIHFSAPLPPAMSFFESPSLAAKESKKTDDLVDEMEKLALAEEIAIASSPFQAVNLQLGVTSESKLLESAVLSKAVGKKPIAITEIKTKQKSSFPLNKEEELGKDQQGKSLIESLSNDTIPVVAVSSVPLFGLSAIITDKTQEMSGVEKDFKNIVLFDAPEQSSFSFFENIAAQNNVYEEPVKSTVGLSIADVKNVLLIEPPQENIGTILKRNTSSSLLKDLPESDVKICEKFSQDRDSTWNLDAAIVTSKENVNVSYDRKASGFFDHLMLSQNPIEGIIQKDNPTEHASDFNICETCREVSAPEDKETENVTRQLIENINSSIQLSNPVEALLTESYPTTDEKAFEAEQFDDINQITEDTIETLQGQAATDLLDDASKSSSNSYGWTTEQLAYATVAAIDQDFGINTGVNISNFDFKDDDKCNTNIDSEYNFKIDPNAIGFFGENSLFFDNVSNNASDEIKAEFKTQEDVVPQLSIPSAPPAEDDSKSDETCGLDVLSIEQDAKQDFPLEEEFIIEPSETDDDKIEFRERKKSSEEVHDTFADRIEKFKINAEVDVVTNENIIYQKSSEYVSPPKSMASYFDTGNYAAETHYRNSLTSPTNISTFQESISLNINSSQEKELPIYTFQKKVESTDSLEKGLEIFVPDEAFRLPPGFEDELRRQYSEQYSSSDENKEPFIPETSTQTRTTVTPTFSTAHGNNTIAVGEADPKTITRSLEVKQSDETSTVEKAFSSTNVLIKENIAFGDNIETKDSSAKAPNENEKKPNENIQQSVPLLDPINFFSNLEDPKPATTEPESFSRLASYFSMPPAQPDHSKSFFELSQSQNHYRHVTNPKLNISEPDNNLSQGQVLETKTKVNLHNLIHDLTSTHNMSFSNEIVRTVNHFSVEYDTEPGNPKLENLNLNPNNSKVKSIEENFDNSKTDGQNKIINKNNVTILAKNSDISEVNERNTNKKEIYNSNDVKEDNKPNKVEDNDINIIKTCEYCCNIKLNDTKSYKVKTAADSDTTKERENDMSETDSSNQKKSASIEFSNYAMEEDTRDGVTVVNESRSSSEYTPVRHHWFYRVDVEDKSVWRGFSMIDSNALEHAYRSSELSEDTLIPTDGGRFDVNIIGRLRIAVYWKEKPTNVRRCSWFYKGTTDARYVPYTEAVADKLEEEYRHGVTTGEWHRRLVLPNNELVVMHGPAVMVHFLHGGAADSFSSPPLLLGKRVYRNPPKIRVAKDLRPDVDHLILVVHGAGEYKRNMLDEQSTSRPRVVRRGCEESEIEDPEPSSIDHLLLLCHGVGSACDMRFRSVEEVVEDFRSTSIQLLQSHYRNSFDNGIVSRVEVLPISWHAQLHVGEGGVDKRLNKVTLESIPRLRAFTNHTVLDALFYTSPVYHQTIIDTVCFELNRIYNLFKQRNPNFKGGISLGGHSLGSVILYDLLCHQAPEAPLTRKTSAHKSYLPGTSQPLDKYPQLLFPPAALYALGSPIAIFECIRGVEALGMDFALPTCKNFFNIFHPYDPIAYRIEPLINPLLQGAKPSLIPHHKGRKRMHLELKDTMVRVGADLKQKLVESLRTTWNKWKSSPPPDGQLEKVVEEEIEKEQLCVEDREEHMHAELTTPEMLGKLNDGRRIDYVLQEAPLEMINEYLFAMSSHVGYWESEDTMLLMLREIYSSLGVEPDCTVPQQSMTVTRTTRQDEATVVNEKGSYFLAL